MVLDDLVEGANIRVVERTFKCDRGSAGEQRSVDDVGVSHDPADVGGGPPDVLGLEVEDPVGHAGDPDRVATVGVYAELGTCGRA